MSSTNITKTVFFDAAPETVWAFLTEKDKLAQWFHRPQQDLVAGKDYALMCNTDDGVEVRQIWGRVLAMDAPSKLVYTFIIDPFNGAETTVTWLLKAAAGGTQLTLLHEGIEEAAGPATLHLLMSLDQGWDEHLDNLRTASAQPRLSCE